MSKVSRARAEGVTLLLSTDEFSGLGDDIHLPPQVAQFLEIPQSVVVAEESSSVDFYGVILMGDIGWFKSMTGIGNLSRGCTC